MIKPPEPKAFSASFSTSRNLGVRVEIQYDGQGSYDVNLYWTDMFQEENPPYQTVEFKGPMNINQALECVEVAVRDVCRCLGDSQASSLGRKMKYQMKTYFIEAGHIPDEKEPRPTQEKPFSEPVRDFTLVAKIILAEELPNIMGGLFLSRIDDHSVPTSMEHVWRIVWASKEDQIVATVRLPMSILKLDIDRLDRQLRSAVQEEIARTRRENPGDFDVLCLDATGIEDKFDVGSTYLAEHSPDQNYYFVYDRYGERSEYSVERFEKVKVVVPKIEKNREKIDGVGLYTGNSEPRFDDIANTRRRV